MWGTALPQSPERSEPAAASGTSRTDDTEENKRVIDLKGRRFFPVPAGDSTAYAFVGDVICYHNGAVITCDSMVRYSDMRIECFGNVLINKDSTYIYGERADYNGDENIARVYSPLIKMIDGDAVLYTYNFVFNTLDNIGEYYGGGTMRQNDNLLESEKGYYYADTREVVCVDKVQLRNENYVLRSDSVAYNMDSEAATFYSMTYIWNTKGEILSALRGLYMSKEDFYRFTRDAYVLSESQEIWADSMDYYSATDDVEMRDNIQIYDREHDAMAFGDYGRYWGAEEKVMLTDNPSVASFDPQQPDTLFLRSDSIWVFTIDSTSVFHPNAQAKENADARAASAEEELLMPPFAGMPEQDDGAEDESLSVAPDIADAEEIPFDHSAGKDSTVFGPGVPADTIPVGEDIVVTDTLPSGPSSVETAAAEQADSLAGMEPAGVPPADSLANAPKTKEQIKEEKALERRRKQDEKAQRRLQKQRERDERRAGKRPGRTSEAVPDSTASEGVAPPADTLPPILGPDSLGTEALADSLAAGQPADSVREKPVDRVALAYRNVRIYRQDFQAVCDSLLAFSFDSTVHMHIDPVLWNGANQIKSRYVQLFAKDGQIDHAYFTGEPIMSAEIDTAHYNQVKGKEMFAYFENNEMYRTDVNGNGQTYYYMQDGDDPEPVGFLVIECADITFLIKDNDVETIIYRTDPVFAMYPMDKIPPDQPQTLPGFVWEGFRRPAKKDVFDRTVRPSRREEYEGLPRPEFPLTGRIDAYRKELVESGRWADRTDVLTQETIDFIDSLGY